MWQYIIGGATIFGLIVGVFSFYNGRATRKYIGELIKEETKRTQEILAAMNKTLEENNRILKQK
jgi:hypothetical protein